MQLKIPSFRTVLFCFCCCWSTCLSQQSSAEMPLLHPLFTEHMVLQRDKELSIWGWTEPGEEIRLSLAGTTATARAEASGRWEAKLGPLPAGGPHTLQVDGPASRTVNDVLVGDVWICSGQSNMEWPVRLSNDAEQEIARADHPRLRLFTVPKRISLTPQPSLEGSWSTCTPESIPDFSAVAYYFGRDLQRELDVPIGLIHTSWGGTVAEAWTSGEALRTMPDFVGPVAEFEQTARQLAAGKFNFEQRVAQWWQQNDPGSREQAWSLASFDHGNWKTMKLPSNWESANVGLDTFDGIVWFRREFDLPENWSGKDLELSLGPIDDVDTTWVNGHEVGGLATWNAPRHYKVAAEHLRPGKNVIAVRVFDGNGEGGFHGESTGMKVHPANDPTASIPLDGEWAYQVSTAKNDLPPFPEQAGNNPNAVSVLFNGMLAPLIPCGIKGAIWYQGESNAGRPMQYRRLLPTMIKDWRTRFAQGDFPFFIVQLANFMQSQQTPVESGWAELREAQLLTSRDPHVGLAVTTDIGEANDIHPRNKQEVGRRLALSALKIAYQRADVVDSGPTIQTMEVVGDSLRVIFGNVGSGLEVRGDTLRGFAIANPDSDEFLWADAKLDGKNAVVVSNEKLFEPIKVRYNWANNPIGNLFNKEGLPAGPFRTDVPPTPEPEATGAVDELPAAQAEAVGMSSEKLAQVKPALQKFVDDQKVAGAIVIAARKGHVVLFEAVGYRDLERQLPMEKDSILRFYSMTKAITSAATMMLVDEGKLELDEPVATYIPQFNGLRVFAGENNGAQNVEAAKRPMTVRDLLRHTSGLTYGFFGSTPVDQSYLSRGVMAGDLQDMVDKLADIPLLYQPGTRFNYSVSTDVLGYLIERVSGTRLDTFFQQRVFDPLDMHDSGFQVPEGKAERFANNYGPREVGEGLRVIEDAATSKFLQPPSMYSGGGGLVSTARDYLRFCQLLLNKGELQGRRLLTSESVAQMTRNQLAAEAYPINLNGRRDGVGFGLGFSVVVERTAYTKSAAVGEFGWGGAASTHFWISPHDELAVVVLTQYMPFSFQLEDAVKPLVYGAIVD